MQNIPHGICTMCQHDLAATHEVRRTVEALTISSDTVEFIRALVTDILETDWDRNHLKHLAALRDYADAAGYTDLTAQMEESLVSIEQEMDEQDRDAEDEWNNRYL